MLDLDDIPRRTAKPLEVIETEKLDQLSVDELQYRIEVLKREIMRTEKILIEKKKSLSTAEQLFRNKTL